MSFSDPANLVLLEQYHAQWQKDPASVPEVWRAFFQGFNFGGGGKPDEQHTNAQVGVLRLVFAHRDLGHRSAHLDPLNGPPPVIPELTLEFNGLTEAHLDQQFGSNFKSLQHATLREILAALRQSYCGMIGYEYMHIQDPKIRGWLQERIEPRRSQPNMTREQKIKILHDLHDSELFEKFLHNRFLGQKRFSLEGAETLIPLLNAFVDRAPDFGVSEYVLGMAHRGRLNVLANVLHKPLVDVFAEFEDYFRDDTADGDGDVKYHLGFASDVMVRGHLLHLTLTPNPSHLEAVNSVVEGRTRAKQEQFHDSQRKRGIPLLIHGDAAFSGQGSVYETLNLSNLDGYTTGGTLHVVINNQIGFTTSPHNGRSSQYCTDVAKTIQAPIFHVNAEDPETVVFIAELALEFRQTFGCDVFIDMYCYRKRGHNEGDEPSFTQPLMYRKIASRPSATKVYTDKLIHDEVLNEEESQLIDQVFEMKLDRTQKELKSQPPRPRGMPRFEGRWKGLQLRYAHDPVATGVPLETLRQIGEALCHKPENLTLHRKIFDPDTKSDGPSERKSLFGRHLDMVQGREKVDWGFAEALAFGSLLVEKIPIRLSGQDSGRGTFSQRHAVLVDQETGECYVPLDHLGPEQAPFAVYDSPLSEFALLGFEFGYTLDSPNTLVLWEAQFGDFANGGQVIVDQFIASSESKWQRSSGLVLLLPHGYEGQGPEHSSARLERFLQLCADDNIQVVNTTAPAQYFHLLRRQVKRNFRKPLIIMTPKSLLRHPLAKSALNEFTTGHFREVLDDPTADANKVRRVVLCSGKIYYDFLFDAEQKDAEKARRKIPADVAIVRVEQFYPFPEEQLQQVLRRYRKATEYVWAQEEPQNMGGWAFMEPRLRALEINVQFVGRDASSSPATGSHRIHVREQKEIVEVALDGPVPHVVRAVRVPEAPPPGSDKVAAMQK
ncbi:MAG TPA: 2-oxoglutarate dehydrogenase E1 component [Gemmataceae bacterium]|nr:2-oxoglutarate dehydrogenase E1 component [Gemmataceae bacterium]